MIFRQKMTTERKQPKKYKMKSTLANGTHKKKFKTINIYKMSNKRCFKNDQRLIQMGCKTDKKKRTKTKVPGLPQSDSNGTKQILSHLLTTREHKDTSVGVVLNRSVCLHRWGVGGVTYVVPLVCIVFHSSPAPPLRRRDQSVCPVTHSAELVREGPLWPHVSAVRDCYWSSAGPGRSWRVDQK